MPPANPMELMAALQSMAGGGAPPGPPMGGPPMGLPGGGPPMGGPGGPGMPGLDRTAQLGLAALDGLANQDRSGAVSVDRIKNGMSLIQRLISAILPQINARGLNPQVYKDLHVIGRQVADAQLNLEKMPEPGPAPESFLMGVQGTGLPSGM